MNRQEALQAFKLLSAVESWAFSHKEHMPDYLHEDLCKSMEVLERIILGSSDAKG
jgi:hypothetical protein